jgi:predicted helicase
MSAIIHHLDLYGRRSAKYSTLESLTIHDSEWSEITPVTPYYFFVPKDLSGDEEYQKGFSVGDMFPVNVTGIVTMGDDFIIAKSREELVDRLTRLIDWGQSKSAFESEYSLGKNYANWIFESIESGKIKEFNEAKITPIVYRPFDMRYTYFDDKFVWRTRGKVTKHMLKGNNLSLLLPKAFCDKWFAHAFISKNIAETIFLSWTTGSNAVCSPLYLYPDSDTLDSSTRTPNLDSTIWQAINTLVGETTPEQILDYIYAVLHSPTYREQYQVFLKTDFPRVPYPRDREQFDTLVRLGWELRGLHLLESPQVSEYITTFPVAGSCLVESPSYSEGRVYINADQYFGGVPELAWTHPIGGYLPAQKWLKDRKWQVLSWEDIAHYQSMIVALSETARVMGEIEKIQII